MKLKSLALKNIPEIAVEAIYLLNLFLVPVWFGYFFPTFNMFELSKTILFRFFVWFLFVFIFIWLIQGGRIKSIFNFFKKKSLSSLWQLWWPPLLLVVGLFALLPFSRDIDQSFFGSYTRVQGLSSLLYYFFFSFLLFFFLISSKILKGKKEFNLKIRRLVVTTVLSGFLVSVYGILQIMNIDFLTWPEAPFLTGRAFSSFGQPNFFASFLLLVIPLSAYLFFTSKKTWLKLVYFLAFLSQLVGLFFSSSRGALVALVAVAGVLALGLFFYSKLTRRTKVIVLASFLLFITASFATLEFFNPGRITGSFDVKQGSLAARVFFFQAASDAILENPVIGYGLENSEEVFIQYYERDWALHGKVSSNADRAHNIVLDVLLTSGFIGLILFSLWFYSIFRLGFLQSRKGSARYLSLALTLGILGYLVSLLFSFQVVAAEIYFWGLFALLAAISFRSEEEEDEVTGNNTYSLKQKVLIATISLIVLLFSIIGLRSNFKLLIADNYLNEMHISLSKMEFIRAQLFHKKIVNINPNPKQLEKASSYLANNLTNYCLYNPWRDLSEEKLASKRLTELLEFIPENKYENLFLKAKIHSCLNNSEEAERYFFQVAEITPSWPQNYLEWGRHYVKQGNLPKAEIFFQLVDINLPDINSEVINEEHRQQVRNYKAIMYNDIGVAYQKQGDYKRALNFLEAAYRNKAHDYTLLKKIADSYYLQGDLDLAIKYNLHGLQANPEDYNWSLALAVLYFENNELAKSIEYLNMAIELAPEDRIESLEAIKKDYTARE